MKKIIALLLLISVFSCKRKDPFSSINYGKANYQETVSELTEKGLITMSSNDSSRFYSNINVGNVELPIVLYFNSDSYNFGSVRSLYVNLSGDSIYDFADSVYFSRGLGPRLYSEVESIYKKYEQWYGKPDSISIDYPLKKPKSGLTLGEIMRQSFQPERLDSSAIPGKTVYWKGLNYNLEFQYSIPYVEARRDSMMYVKNPSIEYSMIDYDKRLEAIRDSIRETFSPEDLISMEVYNPKWNENPYNYPNTFSIEVGRVMRIDKEENRGVVAIKFDLIFRDLFKKEITRLNDVIFEPKSPLMNGSRGFIEYAAFPSVYSWRYNNSTEQGREISYLKEYKASNQINIEYEIKSIVFDDGSVLNKK